MRAPARLWRLGACLLAGAGAAFALPPSPALASTLESAQALRDQGRFAEALALIATAPEDLLHITDVSRRLNNPRNEGADLLQPDRLL